VDYDRFWVCLREGEDDYPPRFFDFDRFGGGAVVIFPKVYSGIKEMARREALKVRTARAIARKAGLRSSPSDAGSGTSTAPYTVIDSVVIGAPLNSPEYMSYQWAVNLTGVTHLRLYAHSDFDIHPFLSAEPEALAPADWQPIYGVYESLTIRFGDNFLYPFRSNANLRGFDLLWIDLAEEYRAPWRLTFATQLGTPPELFNTRPFHVVMQARSDA
jgi:hypothetical protein